MSDFILPLAEGESRPARSAAAGGQFGDFLCKAGRGGGLKICSTETSLCYQAVGPSSGGGVVFFLVRLGVAAAALRGATVFRLIPLELRRFRTGCSSTSGGAGSAPIS